MSEKKCKNCRFWEHESGNFACCGSSDAQVRTMGCLASSSSFSCSFWQERELDFRERLAIYLHRMLGDFRDFSELTNAEKNDCLKIADEIIAMFEKGKGNE